MCGWLSLQELLLFPVVVIVVLHPVDAVQLHYRASHVVVIWLLLEVQPAAVIVDALQLDRKG